MLSGYRISNQLFRLRVPASRGRTIESAACRTPLLSVRIHDIHSPYCWVSARRIWFHLLLNTPTCSHILRLSTPILAESIKVGFVMRLLSSESIRKGLKSYHDDLGADDKGTRTCTKNRDYNSQDDDEGDVGNPKQWKEIKSTLSGFRADQILARGLAISRNKVDDAFLSGKLRINGEKLKKKSRQIVVGDTLDIVKCSDKEGETIDVMRVVFKALLDERTKKGNYVVVLRRWKHLRIPMPLNVNRI